MSKALEIAEAIINEVSTKKWKEAATNSIPSRKREEAANYDEYRTFSGNIPNYQQKQLDKEFNDRDVKLSDRTARASYLSRNLPDSNKSASKVMSAAKKAVKDRTEKTDNLRKEYNNTRDSETATDHNVSLAREKHARMISGKHEAPGDASHDVDSTDKEANKFRREKLKWAYQDYDNADDTRSKEKAIEKIDNIERDIRNNTTRNPKKGISKTNEALELAEAIINEVSIKKWKEAATSVLPKREEEAEAAKASAEKGWEEYDKAARKHPEEEPALYRLAQANDEAAQKAEDKADHAYAVTRLRTNDKANANKAIKAAKKVQDKREDEFGRNPEKRTLLRSGKANQLAAADPVKSRADEALELAEAICDFADNLFELDYEQKQDISPNKIKRTKKDKNGEKVDVVSVADELFPYEGTAKQQFNQKVLAKINDMIEGTGSLEDLIQFVRAGAKVKKVANEGYEAAEEILETALDAILKSDKSDDEKSRLRSELVKARGKERRLADEKAWKSWAKGDLKNPDVSVIRNPEFTKNANGERKTRLRSFDNHYHPKNGSLKVKPEWKQVADSIKRHEKKVANEGYEEAIELIESLKSYILKKYENTDPKDREAGNKLMNQYDKACELKRKAFGEIVKNAGGLKNVIDSKRDTTKNKEGEMDTDWRRSSVDQMRVDLNRTNDPNNERAIKNSIRKNKEKNS